MADERVESLVRAVVEHRAAFAAFPPMTRTHSAITMKRTTMGRGWWLPPRAGTQLAQEAAMDEPRQRPRRQDSNQPRVSLSAPCAN